MLTRKTSWTPLLIVTIVFSAGIAQAQSAERPDGIEQQEIFEHAKGGPHQAIVGTWAGTTATGLKSLTTFGFGGTVINSVQGEVTTNPTRMTHTSHHGVWVHLGGRRYGVTWWDIFYDLTTGQVLQYTKVRLELTLDNRNEMTARVQLDFLNLQGEVVQSRTGAAAYKRIQYEPLD